MILSLDELFLRIKLALSFNRSSNVAGGGVAVVGNHNSVLFQGKSRPKIVLRGDGRFKTGRNSGGYYLRVVCENAGNISADQVEVTITQDGELFSRVGMPSPIAPGRIAEKLVSCRELRFARTQLTIKYRGIDGEAYTAEYSVSLYTTDGHTVVNILGYRSL